MRAGGRLKIALGLSRLAPGGCRTVAKSSPSAVAGRKAAGADPPVGPLPCDTASNERMAKPSTDFAIALPMGGGVIRWVVAT